MNVRVSHTFFNISPFGCFPDFWVFIRGFGRMPAVLNYLWHLAFPPTVILWSSLCILHFLFIWGESVPSDIQSNMIPNTFLSKDSISSEIHILMIFTAPTRFLIYPLYLYSLFSTKHSNPPISASRLLTLAYKRLYIASLFKCSFMCNFPASLWSL